MSIPRRTGFPVPAHTRDSYELVAGMYDLFAAAQGDAAPPRVSAFAELAQPGMRVLDVGAGTGQVALAVAEREADVHCVEPSASMRSALLVKLAQRPALWPRLTVSAGQAPGLCADVTVGDNRYLMTASVAAASAHGVRIRYTYVIEEGGCRTVHTMERPRFFHGFDQVRAGLITAGFAVDAEDDDGRPDPTRPVTARRKA